MADYNGWRNRQTWLINLYELYDFEYFDEHKFACVEDAAEAMRDNFDYWFAEQISGIDPLISDLLGAPNIDWKELAEHGYNDWRDAVGLDAAERQKADEGE